LTASWPIAFKSFGVSTSPPCTACTRILSRRPPFSLWASSRDRKSTRLNSSHLGISYAVFCLKKKKKAQRNTIEPWREVSAVEDCLLKPGKGRRYNTVLFNSHIQGSLQQLLMPRSENIVMFQE